MTAPKPDAEAIKRFIDSLAERLQLDSTHSWWPRFLFHTTELHNAVRILESDQLLSRLDVGKQMPWDNANRQVIEHTPTNVQRMVRFYFRPRTPTTYNNEGFRTHNTRHPQAYCPLPVVLAFESIPILTARETVFSDGNCSRKETKQGTTAEFLQTLPFPEIYHDTWIPEEEKDRIRNHRQAEVLVPSPFHLGSNRPAIRVRSIAEQETLLSQLTPATAARYRDRIRVANNSPLFHKRWTFIESVNALDNQLTIHFNESTEDQYEFLLRLTCTDLDGAPLIAREARQRTVGPLQLSLAGSNVENKPFHLRIELEQDLAYSGILDPRQQRLIGRRP